MASAPEAQALTGVCAPARAPSSSETAAAGPLGMSIGTASGKTRRGPFSRRLSHWSSRVQTPPMPEPMATPSRSGSTSGVAGVGPRLAGGDEGVLARGVEAAGLDLGRATRSGGVLDRRGEGDGQLVAWRPSRTVMVRAPDRPARMASQVSGTVPPRGVVAPRPVTTMRCSRLVIGGAPWISGAAVCAVLGRGAGMAVPRGRRVRLRRRRRRPAPPAGTGRHRRSPEGQPWRWR